VPNIYVRNVSEGLHTGLILLRERGIWQESRSGRVIEYPTPVMTTYVVPIERVLFYPERDANPFFHLFESLWMLAGRDDLKFVQQFNSRMEEFSDDGVSLHGAYGYRWREYFSIDQLTKILSHLEKEPNSRRAVLQMWSPTDLSKIVDYPHSKDVPCNTQVYFKIRNNKLHMTVTCRSNDIIWGTYGANAVHFSVLQEYMATKLGISIGTYYHLSDSFHAYEEVFDKTCKILDSKNLNPLWYDSYLGWHEGMHYSPEAMFNNQLYIDDDLNQFMIDPFNLEYKNSFFVETAVPMLKSWRAYKEKDYETAITYLQDVPALDWKKAATEWLERRRKKWQSNLAQNNQNI
jgi:hypothetical protein